MQRDLKNVLKNIMILAQKCENFNSYVNVFIFAFMSFFSIKFFALVLCWQNAKFYLKTDSIYIDHDFFNAFLFHHIGIGELKVKIRPYFFNKTTSDIVVKYVLRLGLINKTILSKDKHQKLFVRNNYLGIENYTPYKGVMYNDLPKRKIIEGTEFNTYLFSHSTDKIIIILRKFYDWLFEEFKTSTPNKVSGEIADCHFQNFVVDSNGSFQFIDRDVTVCHPVDKSYILYRSLKEPGLTDFYNYFLNHYHIKDESQYYQKNRVLPLPKNNKNLKKAAILNKDLIERIFKT